MAVVLDRPLEDLQTIRGLLHDATGCKTMAQVDAVAAALTAAAKATLRKFMQCRLEVTYGWVNLIVETGRCMNGMTWNVWRRSNFGEPRPLAGAVAGITASEEILTWQLVKLMRQLATL